MAQNDKIKMETKIESIDWTVINRRLKASVQAIERGFSPTESEKKRIFESRALSLAQEHEVDADSDLIIEAVEFLIADERVAIESSFIQEVFKLKHLTRLPHTPPFILGITNLRGQIISIIDIKVFFGLPERVLSDMSKIIFVKNEIMELGILADKVIGNVILPVDRLQESLPTATGIRSKYLKGITEERLILLNSVNILSDENIIVNQEVH